MKPQKATSLGESAITKPKVNVPKRRDRNTAMVSYLFNCPGSVVVNTFLILNCVMFTP
jgi:hypothetical protein